MPAYILFSIKYFFLKKIYKIGIINKENNTNRASIGGLSTMENKLNVAKYIT